MYASTLVQIGEIACGDSRTGYGHQAILVFRCSGYVCVCRLCEYHQYSDRRFEPQWCRSDGGLHADPGSQ
jgi:hypothetical protein